jgi:LysM repeat protein
MNNESPLIPQGSLLEQKVKSRTRVKIAVFFVLAVHAIGLMALLMQGCGRPASEQPQQDTNTMVMTTFDDTNASLPDASQLGAIATSAPPDIQPSQPLTPPGIVSPQPPPAAGTEYTILKNDNFSTIAKKFGVTSKAIADANPGVEPTKLRIGQKIQVPPPQAGATTAATPSVDASSPTTYTVKSGDTLIKISKQFGVTVKAIRSLNNLPTDSIKVGQKLKIPVKVAPPAAAPVAAPEPAPAAMPVEAPLPGAAPAPAPVPGQ